MRKHYQPPPPLKELSFHYRRMYGFSDLVMCIECGALLDSEYTELHDEWHDVLVKR